MVRVVIFLSFLAGLGFLATGFAEIQYNDFKALDKDPVVEESQQKSEPRPVYPPTKKKPYTRSTKLV